MSVCYAYSVFIIHTTMLLAALEASFSILYYISNLSQHNNGAIYYTGLNARLITIDSQQCPWLLHHLVMVWSGLVDLVAEFQTRNKYVFDTFSLFLSFLGLSLHDLRGFLPVIRRNSTSVNSSAILCVHVHSHVSWVSIPCATASVA